MNNEEKIVGLLEALVAKTDAMAEDVQGLKQDVQVLKQDVQVLKQDVQGLKQDVQGLKQEMQSVKEDVQTLQQDVSSLKEITLRMEHDHGQKLTALFDGYSLNYDKNKETELRITALEHKVDKLTFELAYYKSSVQM